MTISADCFKDEELRHTILALGHDGVCDVTGATGIVIDLDALSDFFSDLMSLFKTSPKGLSVAQIIEQDWDFFLSATAADQILAYCKDSYNPALDLSHAAYIDEIENFMAVWGDIKEAIKHEIRFNFIADSWRDYIGDELLTIRRGTRLYRSRINDGTKKYFQAKDLGCPPKEKVSAGRANPAGIPYLYLSEKKDTTFYEVRARYLDRVGVGAFETTKDLNIADFTTRFSLFEATGGDIVDTVKKKIMLAQINRDMSKPMSRYDSELDYIPTQYICELCKVENFDGIKFNSSLQEGGINYVLFHPDDARCVSVKNIVINKVVIEGKGRPVLHLWDK